jgi:uncharacterized delta-60 repeat protein
MTGAALNNYMATECSQSGGAGNAVVNANLLTGGTQNTFLGSDGICWYIVGGPTSSGATVTPLLEFGVFSGTGCNDCFTGGCVNWEVTAGSGGADITLQGCCGDSGTTVYNLSSDEVINICSKTEPIVVTGLATIVNQGICPSCFTPTPTPTETPTPTPTPTQQTAGNVDPSFVIGTGFNNLVISVSEQTDEKIIVGGAFTSYSGSSRNRLVRLNSNGSVDSSFVIGTGFNNNVNTTVTQTDGKILVGGAFTTYSGTARNRIVRLNTNGSVDSSFVIGTGFDSEVISILIQPDGKILAGGYFTSYSGVSRNQIIRLNTDGSVDSSFVVGTGFDFWTQPLVLQTDGKIIVGGFFSSYSGVSRNSIVRLNTDGSIDNTFNIGVGFDSYVYSIVTQTDGKILVGGGFTSYSGISSNRIIRLNTDGSIDSSFVVGTGFDSDAYTMTIQPDGKVLVGGSFTSYNGFAVNYFVRLNTNGSIDNSFNVGSGFNNQPFDISLTSNNTITIGGLFTTYQSSPYNRIIRLDN